MAKQFPPAGPDGGDAEPGSDRGSAALRWAAAAALLGAVMLYNAVGSSDGAVQSSAALPAATVPAPPGHPDVGAAPATGSAPTSPGLALPAATPTRLTIRDIGVNAPFTPLTLDSSGKLNAPPPDNNNLVGWYADGPTPGERGNAIVAGHVDTKTGPAVFLLLRLLKPGSTAEITRADGSTAVFRVDSVETFAKNDFPDQRVYGATADAQLRLITCGGAYDRTKGDYTDNVVVFAHLESSRHS